MATFQYKAFSKGGEDLEGHIEAPNPQIAQKKLKQQGLYIKEIKEDAAKRDRELFPFLSKILYRIPRKEIGLFAKQLGTLLGAGIPINDALNDVWEQTTNKNLKKIIAQIKADITEGKPLSDALADHPTVFPPVYENMVRVGEATGSYETTLDRLAELEEKNADLKGKATTAMIYPVIMMALMVFVVFFLLNSVVPQVESMYKSFENAQLPLITTLVIGLSNFVRVAWPWLILLGFGGLVALYSYTKSELGKLKWHKFILGIPFFGLLLIKINVGRFARNLGVLLEARVNLLTALEIVSATIDNEVFKNELDAAGQNVREGAALKDSLKHSTVFPDMAKGMIAAGESTDRMAELLIKTADVMEREVDTSVKSITNALEPIIIIVMGIVVGGIMFAIMLPIFQLQQFLK